MTGGAGADVFRFDDPRETPAGAVRDVIFDFKAGGEADRIDLRLMDAVAGGTTNEAFQFRGTGAFTGAGQVRFVLDGQGGTIVQGNTDGNLATVEFEIHLRNFVQPLTATDFLL
jgi:Ca2+-binding RTX toxin-like protein